MINGYLDLLDYRRRVLDLYAEVRTRCELDPQRAWAYWRGQRDQLFGTHPQTAIAPEARAGFTGLSYFDYDPDLRFTAQVKLVDAPTPEEIETSGEQRMSFFRIGSVELPVGSLDLYWLKDYGGGIFLPFRDATNGAETYGGGRYLLDTAKGADLGSLEDRRLVLDFNFAYNPSCHYDPRWSCPLSPPANRIERRIEAGEMRFGADDDRRLAVQASHERVE